jgi:type IV secretory pathway TraG/TraD family ATPase VirD4
MNTQQRVALTFFLVTVFSVSGVGQAPTTEVWNFDARAAGKLLKFRFEVTSPGADNNSAAITGFYDFEDVGRGLKGTFDTPESDVIVINLEDEYKGRFEFRFNETEKSVTGFYYHATNPAPLPVEIELATFSVRRGKLQEPESNSALEPPPPDTSGEALPSATIAPTPEPTLAPTPEEELAPTPEPTPAPVTPTPKSKPRETPALAATPADSISTEWTFVLVTMVFVLCVFALITLITLLVTSGSGKTGVIGQTPKEPPFFYSVVGRIFLPVMYGLGFYLYTSTVSLWDYRTAAATVIFFGLFSYLAFHKILPYRPNVRALVVGNFLYAAILFFSFYFGTVGWSLFQGTNAQFFHYDPQQILFYSYAATGLIGILALYNLLLLLEEVPDMSLNPLRFVGQTLSIAFVPPVIGFIAQLVTMKFTHGMFLGSLANLVIGIGSVHVLVVFFFPKLTEETHQGGRQIKTFDEAAVKAQKERGKDDRGLFFGSRETAIPSDKPFHVAFVGASGSGKTTQIVLYGQDALRNVGGGKDHRALLYDDTLSMYEQIRQMKLSPDVKIHNLNPFDKRSVRWAIDLDITNPANAMGIATILFYEGKNESSFYLEYSRGVLAEVLKALIDTKKFFAAKGREWRWGFPRLTDILSDPKKWVRILEATEEGRELLSSVTENAETFGNVKASIMRYMGHYKIIGALWEKADSEISLRHWVADKKGSLLIIAKPSDSQEAVQAINRVVFNRVTTFSLALPNSDTRRIYFFLDELGNAAKWDKLTDIAITGRQKGIVFIIGFQDIEGVRVVYQDDRIANQIVGMAQYKWIGKIDNAVTQEWASSLIGKHKIIEPIKSESRNPGGPGDSVNYQKKIEEAVMAADFGLFPVSNFHTEGIWGWYIEPEPVGAFSHNITAQLLQETVPEKREDTLNFDERDESDQTRTKWTKEEAETFWRDIAEAQQLIVADSEPELTLEALAEAHRSRPLTPKETERVKSLSYAEQKRFYALVHSQKKKSIEELAKELQTREPTPEEEAFISGFSDSERERFFTIINSEESPNQTPQREPGEKEAKYGTGRNKRGHKGGEKPPKGPEKPPQIQ